MFLCLVLINQKKKKKKNRKNDLVPLRHYALHKGLSRFNELKLF